MAVPIDKERFPRVAAYLAGLPDGLDSHPTCLAKGTLVRTFVSGLAPDRVKGAGLPPAIEALLAVLPANSAWLSEVQTWAGIYAFADLQELTGWKWDGWVRAKNLELYTNPVLRLVMNFTSPSLAVPLASAYWGTVHRGSRLSVLEKAADRATLSLDYPPRLFDETAARALGIAFGCAFELSHAKTRSLAFDGWTPTRSLYRASWS